MKTLIIILVLFSSAVLGYDKTSKDLVNFIKQSDKVIMKITNSTYASMVRGDDSPIYPFERASLDLPPRAVFEDDSENTYIVIDNTTNKLIQDYNNRPDKLDNIVAINDDYIIHGQESIWDKKKVACKPYPDESYCFDNIFFTSDPNNSLNNDFILQLYSGTQNRTMEYNKEAGYYKNPTAYCSNIPDLKKFDIPLCEETDSLDITSKPRKEITYAKFERIVSIYNPITKKFFEFNPDRDLIPVVTQDDLNSEFAKKNSIKKKTPKKNTPKIIKSPKANKIVKIGSGSGFFVSDNGHIITNNHVIDSCEKIILNEEILSIIAVNKKNDLALLKSNNENRSYLKLREGNIIQGEDIVVLGFPFGKEFSKDAKITKGIVSSLDGIGNDNTKIQIDAAIQPGNSGGPTVGFDGAVVGVTVSTIDAASILKDFGTIPQNMNFSVKKEFVESMLKENNIKVEYKINDNLMTSSDLFKLINPSTVYLECWSNN